LKQENDELTRALKDMVQYNEHNAGNDFQLQIINSQATLVEELLRTKKK